MSNPSGPPKPQWIGSACSIARASARSSWWDDLLLHRLDSHRTKDVLKVWLVPKDLERGYWWGASACDANDGDRRQYWEKIDE